MERHVQAERDEEIASLKEQLERAYQKEVSEKDTAQLENMLTRSENECESLRSELKEVRQQVENVSQQLEEVKVRSIMRCCIIQ